MTSISCIRALPPRATTRAKAARGLGSVVRVAGVRPAGSCSWGGAGARGSACRGERCRITTRALMQESNKAKEAVKAIQASISVLGKYDFLSTGFGAAIVTSYCVMKGQPMHEALVITVVASVVALVVNELWCDLEARGGGDE